MVVVLCRVVSVKLGYGVRVCEGEMLLGTRVVTVGEWGWGELVSCRCPQNQYLPISSFASREEGREG